MMIRVLLVIIAILTAIGCQRSDVETSNSRVSIDSAVPVGSRDLLSQVLARYQSCSSYSDRGRAVLRVESMSGDGRMVTTTAPLRVSLDRDDLAADAYTSRIRVVSKQTDQQSSRSLIAWFDEPSTSDFDHQVLSLRWSVPHEDPSSSRLSLDRLLQDEVLRSRLSAGLAGPPPQLEWLLAYDPMSAIFADGSRFAYLDDASIGRQRMKRVRVVAAGQAYVFWIEPTQRLIRRVELPLPAGTAAGFATLSLELDDATFERLGTDSTNRRWIADRPDRSRSVPVARLVVLPPGPLSPIVGQDVDITNLTGRARSTVIIYLPDDPGQWSTTLSSLRPLIGEQVDFVWVIDDADARDPLRSFIGERGVIRTVEELGRKVRRWNLPPGGMSLVADSGRVLMFQPSVGDASVAAIVSVLDDFQAGIDVIGRMRRDQQTAVQRYNEALRASRVPLTW